MQILGVQWAQSLANFYWYKGGATESCLFVRWSDLTTFTGIQMRPVGFASANNVVSQYLLFFYAFSILWWVDKKQGFQQSLKWLFIISFACALTGAKVVLAGIVLIDITVLLIAFAKNKVYLFRVFLTTLFAYFCYWLLFPGLFVHNYNLDLFAFNSMIRLSFLMQYVDIPYAEYIYSFLSRFQTSDYVGQRSVIRTIENFGATKMTGIETVIIYLPAIIPACFLLAPLWLARLRKIVHNPYVDMRILPFIMLVSVVASSMGGPFLFTSYFWFFFSFAMYPLSVLLLKHSQDEILGHHISGSSFSRAIA